MACEKRDDTTPIALVEANSAPYALNENSCCPSAPPYSCQTPPTPVETVCVVSQPPVIVTGLFMDKPTATICPSCRQPITTETVHKPGKLTFLLCSAMCCFGCNFGCCFVPFFMKRFKDVEHYCPSCRFHIYRYNRL
ncbi:LITAF domain-containing protein-like [Carettochelys insculpta]|uniref:LITAF domain-containing protein-like n=1 Tax=Carettochelys insculpta TaxID=44489 RepID=UPI003EBE3E83